MINGYVNKLIGYLKTTSNVFEKFKKGNLDTLNTWVIWTQEK